MKPKILQLLLCLIALRSLAQETFNSIETPAPPFEKSTKNSFITQKNRAMTRSGESTSPPADMPYRGILGLGPAWMHFGDKYLPYDSYGAVAKFTYNLTPHVGITADAGLYWHKKTWQTETQQFTQNFAQYNYTAGITWMPLAPGPFELYLQGLAGLSTYSVKDASNGYTSSQKSTTSSFTYNLGLGGNYYFSPHVGLGVEAAYAPTHFYSNTQSNYRLAALVFYRILRKLRVPGQGPVVLASLTGRPFDPRPPLTDPDTPTKKVGHYVHTESEACDGEDNFLYENKANKPVVATLIVTSLCDCGVHVFIWQVKNKEGKNKEEKGEGDTKEKQPGKNGGKPPVKGAKLLHHYDVEKMEGSDVYSFYIPAGVTIEVQAFCAMGKAPCSFNRQFSVTEADRIEVKKPEDMPRLKLTDTVQAKEHDALIHNGNRCISKDAVFHKIHNTNVADVMRVHFKAVSECDCYFHAYASYDKTISDKVDDQYAGSNKVGVDDKNFGVPPGVAPPAPPKGLSESKDEVVAVVAKGKTVYLKGRCPVQNQRPGPCKGKIVITGITYGNN